MSSWWFSWLPRIPTINLALPSSIQGRFVSFVLKKLLGNFVKPGQLDIHQIDSQVGSGFVQVNDLELENSAINIILSDLPVELHSGSIASVVARIPWPNPLTSNVGFSLQSLHLIFHLTSASPNLRYNQVADLSSSVVTIAESFVHDELSPREERFLRESVHSDHLSSSAHQFKEESANIPGGIDPFLSAEDEEFQSETDPEGVSIFASLIERLLARFEFDALDTTITLVHPGRASLTATITEIRYSTESNAAPGEGTSLDMDLGASRRISVSGISVTARDLYQKPHFPTYPPTPSSVSTLPANDSGVPAHIDSPPTQSSRPISRSSSSSSLDEETQLQMSQSILSLPPRPLSPASSVASSLYHSAISTTTAPALDAQSGTTERSHHIEPSQQDIALPAGDTQDGEAAAACETIVSITGSPIIVRLTTPAPVVHPELPIPETNSRLPAGVPLTQTGAGTSVKASEKLYLSGELGTVTCVLRAWQIQRILDLSEILASHRPPDTSTVPKSTPTPLEGSAHSLALMSMGLEVRLSVRHVVLILLPSYTLENLRQSPELPSGRLCDRFFTQPLSPPTLPHGYVRCLLEGLSLSVMLDDLSPDEGPIPPRKSTEDPRRALPVTTKNTVHSTFSISEISVLSFRGSSLTSESPIAASPVLITDRHLPSQYPSTHIHPEIDDPRVHSNSPLPTFDVLDWTAERHQGNGHKLSTWRCKAKHPRHRRENLDQQSPTESDRAPDAQPLKHDTGGKQPSSPAVHIIVKRVLASSGKSPTDIIDTVKVTTAPLHVFADLELLLSRAGISAFLDEILSSSAYGRQQSDLSCHEGNEPSNESEDASTPPTTPGLLDEKAREKERLRLERLVLQDMEVDEDHPQMTSVKDAKKSGRKDSRRSGLEYSLQIILPVVRVEIRAPCASPLLRRSGALVIDLHDAVFRVGSQNAQKPTTRFATTDVPLTSAILRAECNRILVACSSAQMDRATAVLSLGSYTLTSEAPDRAREYEITRKPSHPDSHAAGPRISLNKSQRSTPRTSEIPVLIIDIPSAHVVLSKFVLDDLQYWADDTTQLMESIFGKASTEAERIDSRDTSLIGSRYFAMSKRSDSDAASTVDGRRGSLSNEAVVKISISEGYVRLMVPRNSDGKTAETRPFDAFGSEVDVLMELNPDGKDETVITVGVMDLNVADISTSGVPTYFLSSTSPRGSSSNTKSLLKLRLTSLIMPETTAKESRIKFTLSGFTYNVLPDLSWISHITQFFQAPPHVFESVIPSEKTRIAVKVLDGSVRILAPNHGGALLLHFGEADISTDIVGESQQSFFHLQVISAYILFLDEVAASVLQEPVTGTSSTGVTHWKESGYAMLAEISDMNMSYRADTGPPATKVSVDGISLVLHLCADTLSTVTVFIGDLGSDSNAPETEPLPKTKPQPATVTEVSHHLQGVMSSVDEHAFKQIPDLGPAPDMIYDDLPTNLDYLDESFGTAAGLREMRDDDLNDFDDEDIDIQPALSTQGIQQTGIISKVGGETIKMLRPEGIQTIENYFDNIPPDSNDGSNQSMVTTLSIRIHNGDAVLLLYDGYDWEKTRKTIESEVKEMRRRLAKIRQLVATGQTQDPSIEETGTLLFNSVYVGLQQSMEELEPRALIAAIDDELNDEFETTSQSSWQSFRPPQTEKPPPRSFRIHGKRLTRSRGPCMEFRFSGVDAEIDRYRPSELLLSRTLVAIRDVEILDHIKTSTWQKFLTELRVDSRGNIRETDSNMVRIELLSVRPVPGHPSEEARLRAKILPLRLYVDQDALDFLKRFFSFEDPHAPPSKSNSSDGGIYFQFAEVFPVDLKLDYKPRRVDYRALKEGRTIELMNFFHFDGAEMTLRRITLSGITGWPKFFDLLNDLWTPDVKATQLMEVISGVSPIRSIVNVGSGVADLVLLPIAQYKKDGRIVRGMQKGTTAFVKSTAMEALRLGARLATGTQVILEQAEGVLGSQFRNPVTTETVHVSAATHDRNEHADDDETQELISKYAEQPMDVREGVQTAYRSLQRNFSSAAQTILAVPMEVYERSGSEGPVRAVIRAVPIAVLKPMIGVTEAVSKTLLGIQNSLDPDMRHENEVKYKHR